MNKIKQIINCECGEAVTYRLLTEDSIGRKHMELQCGGCKKHLGFAPGHGSDIENVIHPKKDISPTEAIGIEFQVGKHKGKKIAEVFMEAPGYIRWAAENMNNFTGKACKAFLQESDKKKK